MHIEGHTREEGGDRRNLPSDLGGPDYTSHSEEKTKVQRNSSFWAGGNRTEGMEKLPETSFPAAFHFWEQSFKKSGEDKWELVTKLHPTICSCHIHVDAHCPHHQSISLFFVCYIQRQHRNGSQGNISRSVLFHRSTGVVTASAG